jgi:hypothetical protein
VSGHTETCLCDCGDVFVRPRRSTNTQCLRCQTTERLLAAGITPDDPGLAVIAHQNAMARSRAGIA